MNFSVNQNRQFYVATGVAKSTPTTLGNVQVGTSGDDVYLVHMGQGGLTRTDLINKNKVIYKKVTGANAMKHTMKAYTVALDPEVNEGKVVTGQDYLLRVFINPFVGMSDIEQIEKYGVVHGTKAMEDDASKFYVELVLSLAKNFSREVWPLLKFYLKTSSGISNEITATTKKASLTGTYTGVVIEEAEQDWRRGVMQQTFVNFSVIPTEITVDGENEIWGTVTPYASSTTLNNGKLIADLEYFCMGERGDQYRTLGWPNNIETQYMVDPTQAYDVLDIHYAFTDENEGVQKSEKTLTIVGTTAVITALNTAIETALG